MKVLIADKLPDDVRAELGELGFEVDFQPTLKAEELPSVIVDAHALIVRSTKVTAATIDAASHLQLIVRAGAGTNTIDCKHAACRGVYVANTPGKNALAVAELTLGLVLSLDRRIPENVMELRAGAWKKKVFSEARGLFGRTIGIVGFGRIGQAVGERAAAFGMRVLAWDKALTGKWSGPFPAAVCETLEELLAQADVVTLHLPLTPETRHLIGKAELRSMPEGAYLVNCSRGGVVDDAALLDAVESGHIRAASDVYENEPAGGVAAFDLPLKDAGGIFYGTHHIGASTEQAQGAVAAAVAEVLAHWKMTGEVLNCVNLSSHTPAEGRLVVRHLDKVGVLASVLDVLKDANINVQEMQNIVFEGARAACARITVESTPNADTFASLTACEDVLGVEYLPV